MSLCKLAVDQLEDTKRPLRLAIDISIWQFQVQAARGTVTSISGCIPPVRASVLTLCVFTYAGGSNPAVRTLFYRLVRLLGLSIQPIFVFDGPNKPAFKRNKRSAGPGSSVATAMAKRLIRLFGFDIHDAPGEAEAECALLQRQGIVDAVLSEDVDTIMFGCSRTLRNWTAEGKGPKTPTHVSMYDVAALGQGESGLDREGMVLVAMMSGGDYIPAGVPGCGVKVACEAAKAGFGRSLCKIKKSDTAALTAWRENLLHELRTNESGFFRTRHKALEIPEDFPNMDVLRYYTHPVVSPGSVVEMLRSEFPSGKDLDVIGLREFVRETFDWTYKIGAVKYIRVLAPSLLVQSLLKQSASSGDAQALVKSISSSRAHFTTDATPELRVSYVPSELVEIDLATEEEVPVSSFGRDGLALNSDDEFEDDDQAKGGSKKTFDPLQPDLVWLPEAVAKIGAPSLVQDWHRKQEEKEIRAASKITRKTRAKAADMPVGALDRYIRITKPAGIPQKEADAAVSWSVQEPPEPPVSPLPSLLSSSRSPPPPKNTLQPIVSPARSKPLPNRTSQPKKPQVLGPRPTVSTNPWTLAGSQVSPRVTKNTAYRCASSPKPDSPSVHRHQKQSEPIIISSSPPSCASPPILRPDMTPLRRQLANPPSDSDLASPDPFSSSPVLRLERQVVPPDQERVESPLRDEEIWTPTSRAVDHSALRRTAGSDSMGSPKRRHRAPKRTKSGVGDGILSTAHAPRQTSITDFVLKEAGRSKVNISRAPAPAVNLFIESSDDEDHMPSVDSLVRALSRPRSPPGQDRNPWGCTTAAPGIAKTSESNNQGPHDEGHDPFVTRPQPEPPQLPTKARALEKTGGETKAAGRGITKLYIPRKSGIGYFKEVEVTRDEADRLIAEEEASAAAATKGGVRSRILRRSDIGMVDLTELDD